jgi:hypothetical protein
MEHTWQQRKKDQYGKESKRESKSELGLRAKRNAGMGARVGASLLSLLLAAGPAFSQSGTVDSKGKSDV